MYEELLEHTKELQSLLKTIDDSDNSLSPVGREYLLKATEFIIKAKFWKPELFITVECGNMQSVVGNCNAVINIFDIDNEKENEEWHEKLSEWKQMLESGINNN